MNLEKLAVAWLITINVITFLAFGFDKWRAQKLGRRVPEFTLALLGALGGWPGGFVAMILLRHKTAKWTFQLKYALALIPFAVEMWIFWNRR